MPCLATVLAHWPKWILFPSVPKQSPVDRGIVSWIWTFIGLRVAQFGGGGCFRYRFSACPVTHTVVRISEQDWSASLLERERETISIGIDTTMRKNQCTGQLNFLGFVTAFLFCSYLFMVGNSVVCVNRRFNVDECVYKCYSIIVHANGGIKMSHKELTIFVTPLQFACFMWFIILKVDVRVRTVELAIFIAWATP